MMDLFGPPEIWLPWTFAAIMAVSILIYVILDGFDLGVGLLMPFAEKDEQDTLVASIGPFWDANETWLVLAIGILLVAFPPAHGIILTALYLPVAVLLVGLILRGVSFEFRAKAPLKQKPFWNGCFFFGSLMSSMAMGFMLGMYILGLEWSLQNALFALMTALFLTVGFSFIGAAWLIGKTKGALQRKAVGWARGGIWGLILGIAAISIATPFASPRIFEKWFTWPEALYLSPFPIFSGALIVYLGWKLRHLPLPEDRHAWRPFQAATGLFMLSFGGLAYSFYPYVVPGELTIYDAASAPESLIIILVGALFVMPTILAYTALSYFIFRGKATALSYD